MEPSIDELLDEVRQQQEQVERIQQEIAALEVTGYSRGREVIARIRGSGSFTTIDIDPQFVQRYDAHTLGTVVVEAVNDALRRLGEENQRRYAPLLGEEG